MALGTIDCFKIVSVLGPEALAIEVHLHLGQASQGPGMDTRGGCRNPTGSVEIVQQGNCRKSTSFFHLSVRGLFWGSSLRLARKLELMAWPPENRSRQSKSLARQLRAKLRTVVKRHDVN